MKSWPAHDNIHVYEANTFNAMHANLAIACRHDRELTLYAHVDVSSSSWDPSRTKLTSFLIIHT